MCGQLFAGLVLGELFNPEDGDIMFLGNVSELVHDYMALRPRRQHTCKIKSIYSCPVFSRNEVKSVRLDCSR